MIDDLVENDYQILRSITDDDLEPFLFERYISRRLEQGSNNSNNPPEQIRKTLRDIASDMLLHGEKSIVLENLQPTWLSKPVDVIAYVLSTRLLSSLAVVFGFVATILVGDACSTGYKLKHPPLLSVSTVSLFALILAIGFLLSIVAYFRIIRDRRALPGCVEEACPQVDGEFLCGRFCLGVVW